MQITFRIFLISWILLAGCSPVVQRTSAGTQHVAGSTSSPTTPLTQAPTFTPTYPCPEATQEQPPRVEPVTSPTEQLSQVVHILPGNYDEATVETESGSFKAPFQGADGAMVEVRLFTNTIHHLKVTVHVHQNTYNGCTYGGYPMTVYVDQLGKPLEIVQGSPATPAPSVAALSPETLDRVRLLTLIPLTNNQRAEVGIFSIEDILLTVGFGQGVRRWKMPSGKSAGDLLLNQESITTSVALSQDGIWMATGSGGFMTSDDNQTSVRLWDLRSGQAQLLGHHDNVVECMAFNPGGTLLASGGNGPIFLWDVSKGTQIGRFEQISGIWQIFWADDHTLITRGWKNSIRGWKIPSGEKVFEMAGAYDNMDFYQPAGLVAAVNADGVFLGKAPSGLKLLLQGANPSQGYQQVAFSPDGKMLAALNDQTITFWDTQTQQVIASGKNPAGTPLVFSPDWLYLAHIDWQNQNFSLWGVQP